MGRDSSEGLASGAGARPSPSEPDSDRVEELLRAVRGGDRSAFDELFPLIYDTLRRMAHRKLTRERTGHTLLTTDLVHEAYLKLVRLDRIEWQGRAHFLAIAAQSMRNILVNSALARKAAKRGGGADRPLEEALAVADAPTSDLLALHRALERLEAIDARQSRVVECRFFAGMSIEETAEVLQISPASVKRDWTLARAWLNRELGAQPGP
jgi:RNA polymerase sigma factor (TIGR02999 family)